jgi:DNA polymerase-3 subunit gamma/tau
MIDFSAILVYNQNMSYVSLYRRFRPGSFDKVIGQEHIVRTLTNQVASGRISHAYLFTGARGTGKTSVAKIFAKAVNCQSPKDGSPCEVCDTCRAMQSTGGLDVIEIDAASNNGVDEIRDLNDSVKFKPSVGKYKVYIIDEVHMLSTSAFNAFLKTLEEPPEHVIFCLATTEVQKLPATILSRCMRFDFRLVAKDKIAALIKDIYNQVGFECEDKGIDLIAAHGEGSVRDALSIADMALSYGGKSISYEELLSLLGSTEKGTLHAFAQAVLGGKTANVLKLSEDCAKKGISPVSLTKDLAEFFSVLMRLKNIEGYNIGGYATEQEADKMRTLAATCDNYRIGRAMNIIGNLEGSLRYSLQPQILLDAALIEAAEIGISTEPAGIASRLFALEKSIKAIERAGNAAMPITEINAPKTSVPDTQNEDMPPKEAEGEAPAAMKAGNGIPKAEDTPGLFAPVPLPEESVDDREAASLFADSGQNKEERRAKEILASLVVSLGEDDPLGIIRMALAEEDEVAVRNGVLVFSTGKKANYALLNEIKSKNIINAKLEKIAGLTFTCEYSEKQYGEAGGELIAKLKELFPDELIIKTQKK